ncbi:MAG: hypothetical protein HKO66_08940 [Saprospiraceae bacterium]|nr:hypothetical protein [Bacteroidia bacterium]NNE13492.1 hypothetical protein [Saprospiraceae bacterium]NNL92342.1 hypothetical protein [Saprospiraceae bacterium]
MKKVASKLIVFGVIASVSTFTSCTSTSGYGCDYTEIKTPTKIEHKNVIQEDELKSTYTVIRNVSE